MKINSVERNGNNATVVVEIDKELMETGVNKAYMKARKSIMIPGFRKGKAPRKMIEAMYGAHVFYEDGLEEIFPQVYQFAVVDQGRIIEFGSPEELMAKKGKYYKLIQIQSMGEQIMAQKRKENFE